MKKITMILAVALAAIACNKTSEDVVPEIRLANEEAIVIPQEGTDGIAVQFNASVDWTAAVKNASDGLAVVVTPKSGSAGDARVTIVADKNETNDNLTATLEIKAGTAVKELSITQLQKDAVSADFQRLYEVPVEGQVITFNVAHNIEFTAESDPAEWIQKVESKAMSETEVSFNVMANTGAAREGKIIVKAAGLPDAVATVKQEAWVLSLEVSEKSFEFTTEGGSKEFTVTSNTEYNVTVDENDWLTVDGEDGKYTVTAIENTNLARREASITIAPKDEAYAENAKIIAVSQAGTDENTLWSVNMTEVAFPRVGTFTYVEQTVPTNVSMALFNGDVLVCAGDGTAPVILDKATGQKKGVLDIGNIKPGYITNDDAGNLVFCNRVWDYWKDYTFFTIYYMKPGDTEVTKLVSTADEEYYPAYIGAGLSVKGDVTKKAAIAAPWEGVAGVTGDNMVLCWQVTDGKAGNYVKGTLTGFIGIGWMQGYWMQSPNNFPGFALIGDDLSDGAFLTVYDENKLYKVNADFTCTLLSDDPVLDGNNISNALYTYNTSDNAYLVVSGGVYFSQWGSPVIRIFNQADKSLVADCTTHSFCTEPGDGFCSAAVRMENTAENGLVVYHINNACSVIEAIRIPAAQ